MQPFNHLVDVSCDVSIVPLPLPIPDSRFGRLTNLSPRLCRFTAKGERHEQQTHLFCCIVRCYLAAFPRLGTQASRVAPKLMTHNATLGVGYFEPPRAFGRQT